MTEQYRQRPPPGWYPEPATGAVRYWDGARWGAYWNVPGPSYPQYPAYSGWPAPNPTSTTAAILSHLGFVIGGFILPLIIWLVTDRSDTFTRSHAAEALNFQLTVLIVSVGGLVFLLLAAVVTLGLGLIIAIPAVIAAAVIQIVWCIKGALAASRHMPWRYPVCIRMVR